MVQVQEREYTAELLGKTAELLGINPEYYTVWNHRRRIYLHEFQSLKDSVENGQLSRESRSSQILDIIQLDLQFLFPLLLKYPKCYWIWNHRLWLLQQATNLLTAEVARKLWREDLDLVSKMLARDSRNFLGWGYRRTVVENLESDALHGPSMAKQEFDYTTKMIRANLSNFSAWHNRTKLILRILKEASGSDEERRQMLDDGKEVQLSPLDRSAKNPTELELLHEALFDPFDQSLWFYHQDLMCTFDPARANQTMAPNLTNEVRLEYIAAEEDFLRDMLDDTRDCKWIYQALIDCTLLAAQVGRPLSATAKVDVVQWLVELKKLDPLRSGRWKEFEKSLTT